MHRRTLWTLYIGNLFTSIGLWFFLPLLPIFIGAIALRFLHGAAAAPWRQTS